MIRIILFFFTFLSFVYATKLTTIEKEYLKNNVIKVAMIEEYYPFSYKEKNKINGFSYEYFKLIASKVDMQFSIEMDSWDSNFNKFKEKKVDIIDAISYVKERESFTSFTEPYFQRPNVIFTRKNSIKNYKGLESLRGKKVGITKGIYYFDTIKNLDLFELVPFESSREKMKALAFGKIDAAFNSLTSGEKYISQGAYTNIVILDEISDAVVKNEDFRLGVRRENQILFSIVQKATELITVEEKLKLIDSYFRPNSRVETNSKNIISLTVEEKNYLNNKKLITMCIDPDWEPYEKIDKIGNHVGLVADFIKLIEIKINKKIELIPTKSWDQSLEFVKEKKCEILSFLNQTPQREKFLNFTPTLYEEPEVIVTKNSVPFIDGFESLDNKKVGIVKGYSTDEYIKKDYPKIQIKYTKNSQDGIEMVSEGKIYATVNSLLGTANLIRKLNLVDVKISGKTNMFNQYRVGIIKDDLLLHSILSKAVNSISKKEKENIINNWMSVRFEQDIDYSIFWKIFGGISILILFLLYRDYTVRKINKELEKKMKHQLELMQEKDNMLQEQAKLAQMGEMINMIAHQWRQPLGAISSTIIAMDMSLNNKKFHLQTEENNKEYKIYLESKFNKISQYVQVLSTTIDDFRNFFKPDKDKQLLSLKEPISMALNIIEPSMKNTHYIEILIDYNSEEKVTIFKNELMQVILNILKNAENNFVERDIKRPMVHIEVNKFDKTHTIKIYDNGGGIDENIIEKIFDPYFSTKNSKDGTGIGLYMSKIIIEKHHNGKLIAYNYKNGVCFEIQLT